MSKNKELTAEQVLAWFGEDEKEDIATYLASILNNLKAEGKSEIAMDLHEEIRTYEVDE